MLKTNRHDGIIDQVKLAGFMPVIVGVGAIGRQVAVQLAGIGTPKVTLIDFDVVEDVNIATQGYRQFDLGKRKVDACMQAMQEINPDIEVIVHGKEAKDVDRPWDNAVIFCCVDSMSARKYISKTFIHNGPLFIDGRMSAEVVRVVTVTKDDPAGRYALTLCTDAAAYQERCTEKATIYTANIAGALMVSQLTSFMRDVPLVKDFTLNILTKELYQN